jgi:hypothetical protein
MGPPRFRCATLIQMSENGELYPSKDKNLTQRLSKLHARTYLNACYGTSFMVFSVTYPILRHIVGYINDQQLQHECHLMTLDVQVRLL